jgi:hypothetical protein
LSKRVNANSPFEKSGGFGNNNLTGKISVLLRCSLPRVASTTTSKMMCRKNLQVLCPSRNISGIARDHLAPGRDKTASLCSMKDANFRGVVTTSSSPLSFQ